MMEPVRTRTLVPSAEALQHFGVEVLVLLVVVQNDLAGHLEPGWGPVRVFQILRERDLDWALKDHSRGDQNRDLTE